MQLALAIVFIIGSLLIGNVIPAPRQQPAQISPTPTPETMPALSPTPTLTPTATPPIVPVVLQTPQPTPTPISKYDPIAIAKKIREKYPDAYKDVPDEVLGNLYIKTYITGERSPSYLDSGNGSRFRPLINCTSNSIGSYTYTQCY